MIHNVVASIGYRLDEYIRNSLSLIDETVIVSSLVDLKGNINPETENKTFRAKNLCLCIGNFDGIHLGHQHVIKKILKSSQEHKMKSAIIILLLTSLIN